MSEYTYAASVPADTYEFTLDDGSVWRYTSFDSALIVGGNTFSSLKGLSCTDLSIVSNLEKSEFTVSLPGLTALAKRIGYFGTPRKTMLLWRRYQRDNLAGLPVTTYRGELQNTSLANLVLTLKFPSVWDAAMQTKLPKDATQTQCNNTLFDGRCGLGKTRFQYQFGSKDIYTSEYLYGNARNKVLVNVYTSKFPSPGPYQTMLWKGGTLKVMTGSKVTYYTINDPGVNNWQSHQIGLGYYGFGFVDTTQHMTLNGDISLDPASTYEILPGCDNDFTTCGAYGNQARFNGFPFMPTEKLNPFRIDYSKSRKP